MARQSIEDLIPLPTRVPVGAKHIEVRGLTLEEIVALLRKYKDEVLSFLNSGDGEFDKLTLNAPALVAEVIAYAADTPDQVDAAKRLPFAAQVEIITAIWELSVPDLKKLGESLAKAGAALGRSRPAAMSIPDVGSSDSSSMPSSNSLPTDINTTT